MADRFAEMFEPSARRSFNEAGQVRHLFRAVDERIGSGELLDIEVVNVCVRMIKTNGAVEPKLLGTACEARDVHVIVERVPRPANVRRCRGNQKPCVYQTLIMAVSRTQHHPVFAEGNRLSVPVGRDVLDGQYGHRNPFINVQYHLQIPCNFCASDRPLINVDGVGE